MLKIKRGLDICVEGEARKNIAEAAFKARYAVKPTDFVGLVPRVLVAEGDAVACGQPLVGDKADPRVVLTSPVSGTVEAVVRGQKRALLAVVVAADGNRSGQKVDTADVRQLLLQTGLWSLLRRRPFGSIPSPDAKPKAMFVSCFDSAPLSPDYDFVLNGRDADFAAGLEALTQLTDGLVHVTSRPDQHLGAVAARLAKSCERVVAHTIVGPHPAGNVGTQIALIDPIDKGQEVWTFGPQEVALVGRTILGGEYCPDLVVAVAGPAASHPQYYKMRAGRQLADIMAAQISNPDYPALEASENHVRVVSGDVLSGLNVGQEGYLSARHSLVSLLPEGDYYDFMGWLMPGLHKFSFSRTFLSGFTRLLQPYQSVNQYLPVMKFDTNRHGDVRPLVFSGSFERVFPFDIYPTELIKACVVGDVERMEKLGIYEVEPEDFALCEVIDPSKTEIQQLIRESLEKLRKEAM